MRRLVALFFEADHTVSLIHTQRSACLLTPRVKNGGKVLGNRNWLNCPLCRVIQRYRRDGSRNLIIRHAAIPTNPPRVAHLVDRRCR